MTRKQIYEIIEKDDGSSVWSHLYDVFMFGSIILSVVPLMFWEDYPIFWWIELFITTVFVMDYILRWVTADYKLGKGAHSFVSYPYRGHHRPVVHPAQFPDIGSELQDSAYTLISSALVISFSGVF